MLLRYTDLIAAVINFAIAVGVVWQVRRLRSVGLPPVVWALAAFFLLRTFSRLNQQEGIPPLNNVTLEITLDIVTDAILIYLLLNVGKIARALLATFDEANFRAGEYDRALRHYTQIVRHRMMNPLTVITGSAQTLKTGAVSDPDVHSSLCDVILRMAEEVERTTLEPERRDARERELDAIPSRAGADALVAPSGLPASARR